MFIKLLLLSSCKILDITAYHSAVTCTNTEYSILNKNSINELIPIQIDGKLVCRFDGKISYHTYYAGTCDQAQIELNK